MHCVSSLCSFSLFILYSYQKESLQIMMPLYTICRFKINLNIYDHNIRITFTVDECFLEQELPIVAVIYCSFVVLL